jgi:hypothetical protein
VASVFGYLARIPWIWLRKSSEIPDRCKVEFSLSKVEGAR